MKQNLLIGYTKVHLYLFHFNNKILPVHRKFISSFFTDSVFFEFSVRFIFCNGSVISVTEIRKIIAKICFCCL